MRNRLERFHDLKGHPYIGRLFKQVTKDDLQLCEKFIVDNDALSLEAYLNKLSCWYLDSPNKPKNLYKMWAILIELK